MDVYIDGYVSKKAIKNVLNNWYGIGAKKVDYSEICHDNPLKNDGVSGGRINKMMIEDALNKIPDKITKYCAYARWIRDFPGSVTCDKLGISRHTYNKYCDKAVDFIYQDINGQYTDVKS